MITECKNKKKAGESADDPVRKESVSHVFPEEQELRPGMAGMENEYQVLLKNLPIGVFKITPDGELLNINRAFARIHDYDTVEDALQHIKNISDTYVFADRRSELLNKINGEEGVTVFENLHKKKTGDYFIAEVQIIQVCDPDQKVLFLEGTIQDVSEKKLFIDKLQQSKLKLEEENETQQRLFNLIAHDLRNPAAQLIIINNLIKKSLDSEDHHDLKSYADFLNRAVHNINDLLNNLLSWSLLRTKKLAPSPVNFSVKRMIEPLVRHLTILAMNKNIGFKTELESGDLEIFADEEMITTAVRNLGTNAIKYSYPNSEITIRALHHGHDKILVQVTDQGRGIRKEDLAKLFQLSHPFTTQGTNNEKGTGLGLILCKEFIEKNKGEIWVDSEPDKGSSFSFILPAAKKTD